MPEPAPQEEQKPTAHQEAANLDELAVPHPTGDDTWDVVFSYTRAQALEDGVLIDVSERAKEAGFRFPVAVTAALWGDIEAIPESYQGIQDVEGRLWDVLWMGRIAVQHSKGDSSELVYRLIMHVGKEEYYTVKLVCGPGDAGEPVITVMRPDED